MRPWSTARAIAATAGHGLHNWIRKQPGRWLAQLEEIHDKPVFVAAGLMMEGGSVWFSPHRLRRDHCGERQPVHIPQMAGASMAVETTSLCCARWLPYNRHGEGWLLLSADLQVAHTR